MVVFHLLNAVVLGSMSNAEFLAKPRSIWMFVCIIKENKNLSFQIIETIKSVNMSYSNHNRYLSAENYAGERWNSSS